MKKNKIIQGDCIEVMKEMEENSIDTIITDPPYLLGFMGKEWDKVNLIEPSFGYWFSGFVDGEGCFRIHRVRNGDYYECHFQVKLRKDDKSILKEIKSRLGFGRIQDNKPEGNSKPTTSYLVNSRSDCFKLAELFLRFPLKAKKQRDFFKWYEALLNWKYQKKGNRWHGKPDVSSMEKNWKELKEVRKYKENPTPINQQEFFHYLWAKEALRIAKPGATMLVFGGTRMYHRLACGIEDAGWQIRDTLMWIYGSGFPKSHNIGKAVDKIQGNKRKKIAQGKSGKPESHSVMNMAYKEGSKSIMGGDYDLTKGNSEWEGYGTALKPAYEPIIMAMKPNDGTYAENALKHDVAGLNIDGARIEHDEEVKKTNRNKRGAKTWEEGSGFKNEENNLASPSQKGRFPANLIHDGSKEATKNMGDKSRYFYCAKASKKERNMGLEDFEEVDSEQSYGSIRQNRGNGYPESNTLKNNHPTVKPLALMEYLVELTKMPNKDQIYLDPFVGSGTTLMAVKKKNRNYIGIEKEPEYVKIAEARIKAIQKPLI